MLPVIICIAGPLIALGLFAYMRSLYGDELFGLGFPPYDLNREDDYRLIKMPLNSRKVRKSDSDEKC